MNQNVIFIILVSVSVVTKTYCDSPPVDEDFVDEYYTVTPTKIDKITEQDHKYAQTVLDTDKESTVLMSIFVYQSKIRRRAISQEITDLNQKIVDKVQGLHERRRRRRYWISEWYMPQYNLLMDLCYSMLFNENAVLAQYLYNFFFNNDYTMITIAMVLTKDMMNMISKYDEYNCSFKDDRKDQGKSFEHMLRVWVRQNRESMDNQNITPEAIKLNAENLKKDHDDDCWEEKRDQLELIVIKKNIKFARLVIQEFENINGGKRIEDMMNPPKKTLQKRITPRPLPDS